MSVFNRITHSRESASPPFSHDVFISPGKNLGFPLPEPFGVSSMLPEHAYSCFPYHSCIYGSSFGAGGLQRAIKGNVQLHNKNEARKNVLGRATNPYREGGEPSSPWVFPGLGCCFPGSEHTEPGKVWLSRGCSLKLGLQVKPGTLDQHNELGKHGTVI